MKTAVPASMLSSGVVKAPQPSLGRRAWESTKASARALKAFVFQRQSWRSFWVPGSKLNYVRDVGDGTGSSTVTAPLFWMARTFPEAPPAIWLERDDGQEERVLRHPLLKKLSRPNDFYTGPQLWAATVIDYMVDGNAYWLKLRAGTGAVGELWWVPHWAIEPRGSDSRSGAFIDHYRYTPGTDVIELDPSDVVHFRFGLDPDDPRFGRSPLKSILREVFTDDEAANFTASLLRNMGVPGVMVSPDKGVSITVEEAEQTKQNLLAKFTGDKRGEPIVMTGATRIEQFGFSPEQLTLRELRRIPEERVTAVLGVPAIVAGLGAGLDRSTFTNMAEAREAAYESGIIPMQRNLGEDVRFQLLPDFATDPDTHRFGFDLAKVRVLQEDLYRLAQRVDLAWRGGWAMRSEARRALGLEVDPERDDVFYQPLNVAIVQQGEALPPNGNGSTNGNGASDGGPDPREVARELARQLELTSP